MLDAGKLKKVTVYGPKITVLKYLYLKLDKTNVQCDIWHIQVIFCFNYPVLIAHNRDNP